MKWKLNVCGLGIILLLLLGAPPIWANPAIGPLDELSQKLGFLDMSDFQSAAVTLLSRVNFMFQDQAKDLLIKSKNIRISDLRDRIESTWDRFKNADDVLGLAESGLFDKLVAASGLEPLT